MSALAACLGVLLRRFELLFFLGQSFVFVFGPIPCHRPRARLDSSLRSRERWSACPLRPPRRQTHLRPQIQAADNHAQQPLITIVTTKLPPHRAAYNHGRRTTGTGAPETTRKLVYGVAMPYFLASVTPHQSIPSCSPFAGSGRADSRLFGGPEVLDEFLVVGRSGPGTSRHTGIPSFLSDLAPQFHPARPLPLNLPRTTSWNPRIGRETAGVGLKQVDILA